MNTNLSGIQPHYTIIDSSNKFAPALCQLHLVLAPSSITIATYHIESNTLCNLKKYLLEEPLSKTHLQDLFLYDSLLQFHYYSYYINLFSTVCNLIPNSQNLDSTDFYIDDIPLLQAKIYYAFQNDLIDFLKLKLPFHVHSYSAAIINALIKKQQHTKESTIYANCFDKHLEIFAFENEQLVLHNIFPIEQPEDFSYYILSVYESLRFNTSIIKTILLGNISKPSRIHDLLYTYIKDVDFINKQVSINYTNSFEDIEDHIIYPIASLIKP